VAANSYNYWRFAEGLRDELESIFEDAKNAYTTLEQNDDPGELADLLADIRKRLNKAHSQIAPALPPLRKTAAALSTVPEFKS
jgi:ABC-type transporter Mla subunit MlaD